MWKNSTEQAVPYSRQDESILPGLSVTPIDLKTETSLFDLMLDLTHNEDEVVGSFRYNSELFEQKTIDRMARQFESLMDDVAQNPDKRLSQIEMMTEEEREEMLSAFNRDLEFMPGF